MNPLQAHFTQDDESRRLFNELVEQVARCGGASFTDVYRDLMQVLNSVAQYVIEEEP